MDTTTQPAPRPVGRPKLKPQDRKRRVVVYLPGAEADWLIAKGGGAWLGVVLEAARRRQTQ